MSDLTSGKSIVLLGVLFSCFVILWPKIFYPLFFGDEGTVKQDKTPNFHPAFKEKNRLFYGEEGKLKRTINKDMRAGPMPGMRPTFGGPGMAVPSPNKNQGSMGILMPMYTIGIIIFFVYTTMKIVFVKQNEETYSENSKVENCSTKEKKNIKSSAYSTKKINALSLIEDVEKLHQEILDKQERQEMIPEKLNENFQPEKIEDERESEIALLKKRLENTEKVLELILSKLQCLEEMNNKRRCYENIVQKEDVH